MNAGVGKSFLCLQRVKELLVEGQQQFPVVSISIWIQFSDKNKNEAFLEKTEETKSFFFFFLNLICFVMVQCPKRFNPHLYGRT